MGANLTKEEIRQILNKNLVNPSINKEQKYPRIEYKINYRLNFDEKKNPSSDNNEKENEVNGENDSFILSDDPDYDINNPLLDVKDVSKFPYSQIGTITVKFPVREEIFVYTCFLIHSNAVVTLASNLESKSKGGKAKSIVTSFSEEKVTWENIFIQGEEIPNENSEEDKIPIDSLENLSSKLAVIIYKDDISNEWLGVEGGKKLVFEGREKFAVFSLKEENDNNIITIDEKNKDKKPKLREIPINYENPFFDAQI